MSETSTPTILRQPNGTGKFAKGTPGKQVGQYSVVGKTREMLKQMGFDPIREAVNRYRDPDTPNASKDYCLGLITDRVLPKLKAVEVTANNGALQQVLINIIAGNEADKNTVLTGEPAVPTIEADIGIQSVAIPNDEQYQEVSGEDNA